MSDREEQIRPVDLNKQRLGEDETINEFKKFAGDLMKVSSQKYSDIENLLEAKKKYISSIAEVYDNEAKWYKNEHVPETKRL